MRKLLTVAAASLAATLALSGCSGNGGTDPAADGGAAGETVKVVVGASPVPHAQILEFVQDELAAEAGIELEIREFDDYVLPNQTLSEGELDANYFQHLPYYEAEVQEKGYEFEHGEGVHIEPLRLFSSKVKSAEEIADGATIAITNDISNQARGLLLLQAAGLLDCLNDESTLAAIS